MQKNGKKGINENPFSSTFKTLKQLKKYIDKHKLITIVDQKNQLMTINYHFTNTVRSQLNNFFRGLTIEIETLKIIARGFSRFFHESNQKNDDQILEVQGKVDGSMMILYNYMDQWRVNTRYNFSNDTVHSGRCTYKELFFSLIDEKLFEKYLEPDYSYIFEMCTEDNRIITPYESARLFLLGSINNKTGQEIKSKQLQILAKQINVFRPKIFQELKSVKQIEKSFSKCPYTFEGYVVLYKDKKRKKFKNPFYRIIHALKFRNWIHFTPKFQEKMTALKLELKNMISTLMDVGYNKFEIEELQYLDILYSKIRQQDKFQFNMKSVIQDLDQRYHKPPFCKFPQQYEPNKKSIGKSKQKEGKWKVKCTCKEKMQLIRLKRSHAVPSFCHCGKRIGFYKIENCRLVYICKKCGNTHEAHQKDVQYPNEKVKHLKGEPLGFPASKECKIYRLNAHEVFDKLWRYNPNMKKNQAYEFMANLLGIEKERCHMAKFSIEDCRKVITLFQQSKEYQLAIKYQKMPRSPVKNKQYKQKYKKRKK